MQVQQHIAVALRNHRSLKVGTGNTDVPALHYRFGFPAADHDAA